jgi:hypothetical protein
MPNLAYLFQLFDRFVFALVSQFMPASKVAPSSCVDIFYGAFMSAIVIGIIQPTAPDTAGFLPPPSERPTISETVERFAPEVRFHPEERYFPSSVDWFLERSEMHLEVAGDADLPTLAHGEVAPAVIPAMNIEGTRSDGDDPSRYFLQITNDADERQTRQGDIGSAETYAHFRKAADGSKGYDIQYWFFFPYSGPLMGGPVGGAHEGDWEHITVRLDDDLETVRQVYYAAHDAEGRWVRPSQMRFKNDTHPVVYIARFGHAAYPRPGLKPRGMLPADHTAGGGVVWKTWQHLQLVADDNGSRDGFDWLRYSGRWGEVGSVFSGPHGPAFQQYWLADN